MADQVLLEMIDLFGEGKYFLVPAFFRLVLFLKKSKREFDVVFHSHDQDLPKVSREFNK